MRYSDGLEGADGLASVFDPATATMAPAIDKATSGPRWAATTTTATPTAMRSATGQCEDVNYMPKISDKAKARQNVLVSVVNTALERGLLTLAREPLVSATFEYTLAGLPMIAEIHDVGFDEVHLYAHCCPTDLGRTYVGSFHSQWDWKRFCEAWAFGCLERRTGKYLQTTVSFNGSRIVTAQLASVVIEPAGFGLHPSKGGYDFNQEWDAVCGKKPKRKIAA